MTPLEWGLIAAIHVLIVGMTYAEYGYQKLRKEIKDIHKSLKSNKYIKLPPRGQNGRFLKK